MATQGSPHARKLLPTTVVIVAIAATAPFSTACGKDACVESAIGLCNDAGGAASLEAGAGAGGASTDSGSGRSGGAGGHADAAPPPTGTADASADAALDAAH
jgi:hypothetical protein